MSSQVTKPIPDVAATLMFVIKGDGILLIRQKRGIGEGLWNGVGGHIEKGETPIMAAIREFKEEVKAEADDIRHTGILDFYIPEDDGFSMRVHVFVADTIIGAAKETDEARPQWWDICDIPYGEMWPDDRIWMPHLLAGRSFEGSFTLTKDKHVTEAHMVWQ